MPLQPVMSDVLPFLLSVTVYVVPPLVVTTIEDTRLCAVICSVKDALLPDQVAVEPLEDILPVLAVPPPKTDAYPVVVQVNTIDDIFPTVEEMVIVPL